MDFRDRVIEDIQGMGSTQWFLLFVGAIVLLLGIVLASDNVCADGRFHALSRLDCSYAANQDCDKTQFIDIRYYSNTSLCAWNCLPYRHILSEKEKAAFREAWFWHHWIQNKLRRFN